MRIGVVGLGFGEHHVRTIANVGDAEHAAELAAICESSTAPVMTGFSFRFHPVVQRAIALVQSDLGSVQLGTGSYLFNWLPAPTA